MRKLLTVFFSNNVYQPNLKYPVSFSLSKAEYIASEMATGHGGTDRHKYKIRLVKYYAIVTYVA